MIVRDQMASSRRTFKKSEKKVISEEMQRNIDDLDLGYMDNFKNQQKFKQIQWGKIKPS